MDHKEIENYRTRLLQMRTAIINGAILNSKEEMAVSPDDLADETDLASTVINQAVAFNIKNRELAKLHAIDEALQRVKEGTYGHCEECDAPIGSKRLQNQPWATLCIAHAEENEREKSRHFSHTNSEPAVGE